jgi:hypothetical protein
MVLILEKVPDSNAHDDHEDQDYELSIHLLPLAQSSQASLCRVLVYTLRGEGWYLGF